MKIHYFRKAIRPDGMILKLYICSEEILNVRIAENIINIYKYINIIYIMLKEMCTLVAGVLYHITIRTTTREVSYPDASHTL